MAIYHLSMKPISRRSGRSAVAAAAYRSGERLTNERDGLTHDFSRKQGIEHSEIVLPEDLDAEWAHDQMALWNAAELSENRKDARVAREFEIALPHELTANERVELARSFAQDLADRHGAAVDVAVHAPHGETDVRNHHAHLMMTTRTVEADGLGDKTDIERENKWLLNRDKPTSQMQLRDLRQAWEDHANEHLARAGHDVRIDHRSHQERGLEIEPTEHMGVHATQMDRRGKEVNRTRLDADAAERNADVIREKPEQVLTLVSGEKSVFDRHDVARALHRYIDDRQEFQNAFASVMASPGLVELQGEREGAPGQSGLARYSTREMVDLERDMAASAERMGAAVDHGVDARHVDRALARHDDAIRSSVAASTAGKFERGELSAAEREQQIGAARLSDEQRSAVGHVTGPERIAAVVGYAGAGKSTMLAAAREAWEAEGYKVHGAALAGKAAEGLEESSGIESRTLASWEYGWQSGQGKQLGEKDVLVIDEAGMVGSKQLAHFVDKAEKSGAKLVLVGDHEQLQAIGAGAPFRAIAERVGHAELSEIRRQRVDWQRDASVAFASHKTADGLAAYERHGAVQFSETSESARNAVVRDYLADREARPQDSRLALAHRRADVRALNEDIRSALQERGELAKGEDAGEISYRTNDGRRSFAAGDRVVFLENNKDLGVKNGMLGTVEAVKDDQIIARLDGKEQSVRVPMASYDAIDHGYATTIHKTQGATADRAFVMASATMDRHLTYVAMTRHRDSVQLYAAQDEFTNRSSGRLVDHGSAPYQHDQKNRESYFVTLESENGEHRTVWGKDLGRAMAEAAPERGARIGLEHAGSETITLANGASAERHTWEVHGSEALARKQFVNRLSRSGLKETTLDYSERQQEASPALPSEAPEKPQEAAPERRSMFDGLQLRGSSRPDERAVDPRHGAEDPNRSDKASQTAQEPQEGRRGMFDGLRLSMPSGAAERPAGEQDRPEAHRSLPASDLERSVDRYGRAVGAIDKMVQQDLPVLDSQMEELTRAGAQLEKAQPGSSEVMHSALKHDPETFRAATELTGKERTDKLMAGLERERQLQADPNVRAGRLADRWQSLSDQHRQLGVRPDAEDKGRIEGDMREVAETIRQDPEAESILRAKARELGLRQTRPDQSVDQAMDRQVSRDRDMGMER